MLQQTNLSLPSDMSLRPFVPSDSATLRELYSSCFPVKYSDIIFDVLTSNMDYFSLAAISGGQLIGFIVADVDKRDKLSEKYEHVPPVGRDDKACYILSIAVRKQFRKRKLGTLLMNRLMGYLAQPNNLSCKAIYLHVLVTNMEACNFYESFNFILDKYIPEFYPIKGRLYGAIVYTKRINEDQSTQMDIDQVGHVLEKMNIVPE